MVVGNRVGQAIGARGILRHVPDPLLVKRFGPRLNIFGTQVPRDVAVVPAHPRSPPDAGEIRFSIRRSRGGRRKIRFAVGRARDAGRRVVEPLRGQRHAESGNGQRDGDPVHDDSKPAYRVGWGSVVIGRI